MPTVLVRTLLIRGTFIWVGARIIAMAFLLATGGAEAAKGGLLVPAWTLTLLTCLMLVDLRRRKELMLLHNLGVTTLSAVVIGSLPALLFEALLPAALLFKALLPPALLFKALFQMFAG